MEQYKEYMDGAFAPYYTDEQFIESYGRIPKFRYDTFKYCWDWIQEKELKTIVELGTSRSFVDGKYPGCNSDDVKFWEPDNPEIWDWSAGCFTRVFGELIQGTDIDLITVDLMSTHIARSKAMTQDLENIEYFSMSSEEFLTSGDGQIDFLYMDTGDVTPIEPTARLHLRESEILVENDLISDNGLILIDDVRNIQSKSQDPSDYGKAKYSIPYLQENGFEVIMDEYQVLLQRRG
jgi:hypothetical protein